MTEDVKRLQALHNTIAREQVRRLRADLEAIQRHCLAASATVECDPCVANDEIMAALVVMKRALQSPVVEVPGA